MTPTEQLKERWAGKLQPLVGLRIKAVRYMDQGEIDTMGISKAPVVLELSDGTLLWPMADDEGNDGGSLSIQPGKTAGIPDGAPTI